MNVIEEIVHLFETRGSAAYLGEPLSQREHALQAAYLAVLDGASDALVAAALLHDVGHLLGPEDEPAERGIDALHEQRGCNWLSQHFGPEVTEPVRLHVIAKRYLCAVDQLYRQQLSPASIRSLELQGGVLLPEEVRAFEVNRFWRDAIKVRRWDDRAKAPAVVVPDPGRYAAILGRELLPLSGPSVIDY